MAGPEWDARIWALQRQLGEDLVILGHHYQRDKVIQFADFRGDSFKLSQQAAGRAMPNTSSSAACTSWPKVPTSSLSYTRT
jgi:quinolinate synthase